MNELFQVWRIGSTEQPFYYDGDEYTDYEKAKEMLDWLRPANPDVILETRFTTEWKPAREVSHA